MKMPRVQGHEFYFFFWTDRHFCYFFGTTGKAQKGHKNQKTQIIGRHELVRFFNGLSSFLPINKEK